MILAVEYGTFGTLEAVFETKSVDEFVSCGGGKKLESTSPIQFTPLNGDAPEEPQFRRILSEGTLIESQVAR